MRLLSCMLLICAGLAAEDPARPASGSNAVQTKKAPAPLTVPADAVPVSPGLYRWIDRDGKSWMYRGTPFGVSRWQEDVNSAPATAVEEGDSIRFVRSTPFGKRVWVRKKTELTEAEQKIWASQQEKAATSRTAEKE